MSNPNHRRLVLSLYRSLLREAREVEDRMGGTLFLHAPVQGGTRSGRGRSFPSSKKATAEEMRVGNVFPPSAIGLVPEEPQVAGRELMGIVRGAFKAGAGILDPAAHSQLVDEAFHGLRSMAEQKHMQRQLSMATTDGLRVVASSRFLGLMKQRAITIFDGGAATPPSTRDAFMFGYRIRFDNVGEETLTVVGRSWRFYDAHGVLHTAVNRQPQVVGEMPVLRPGQAFIYESQGQLDTARGHMDGSFHVVLGELPAGEEDVAEGAAPPLREFDARVAALRLDSEA